MNNSSIKYKIIGIGAVLVDEIYYSRDTVINGTSNPATMQRSAGGVMRNIMHHLAMLGCQPSFLTVAGDDEEGNWLIKNCKEAGIDIICKKIKNTTTGKYVAFLNPGGLLHAAVAFNPCGSYLNIEFLREYESALAASAFVLADTNLEKETLQWLINFCGNKQIKLCIEPVSIAKAKKLADLSLDGIYLLTPNEEELHAVHPFQKDPGASARDLLKKGVQNIWLRCGEKGSVWYSKQGAVKLPAPVVNVADTTGAGDAALAGWLASYLRGFDELTCLKTGHALAAKVLETSGAIAIGTNFETVINSIKNFYPVE